MEVSLGFMSELDLNEKVLVSLIQGDQSEEGVTEKFLETVSEDWVSGRGRSWMSLPHVSL